MSLVSASPFLKILTIAERDFVSVKECSFGGHPIRSGTGYILVDPNDKIRVAGPVCAENHGIGGISEVPDYTRAMKIADDRDDNGVASNKGQAYPYPRTGARQELRVLEYVTLRAHKMPALGFPGLAYQAVDDAYRSSLYGPIPPVLMEGIGALMKNVTRTFPKMTYERLMGSYAVGYWVQRCEKSDGMSKDDRRFLDILKQDIHAQHNASQRKLNILNRMLPRLVESPPYFRPNIFGHSI